MKKVLAMFLVLLMVLCTCVACSDDIETEEKNDAKKNSDVKVADKEKPEKPEADTPEDEKKTEAEDEEEAEEVMREFAKRYFYGKAESLTFVADDSKEHFSEEMKKYQKTSEAVVSVSEKIDIPEKYRAKADIIIKEMENRILGDMNICVDEIDVSGNKAEACCSIELPDFENIGNIVKNIDKDEFMSSLFTEEEIEALKNASEDEQAEAAFKIFKAMLDYLDKELSKNPITLDSDFSLEKIDGKWYIVA